jgi:hypothetical protein
MLTGGEAAAAVLALILGALAFDWLERTWDEIMDAVNPPHGSGE